MTADDHSAAAPHSETCNESVLLLSYKLCTITRFYEFEFGTHVLHKTLGPDVKLCLHQLKTNQKRTSKSSVTKDFRVKEARKGKIA